jgi:hypothetical protein
VFAGVSTSPTAPRRPTPSFARRCPGDAATRSIAGTSRDSPPTDRFREAVRGCSSKSIQTTEVADLQVFKPSDGLEPSTPSLPLEVDIFVGRVGGAALPALFAWSYAAWLSWSRCSLKIPERPRRARDLSPRPVPKSLPELAASHTRRRDSDSSGGGAGVTG